MRLRLNPVAAAMFRRESPASWAATMAQIRSRSASSNRVVASWSRVLSFRSWWTRWWISSRVLLMGRAYLVVRQVSSKLDGLASFFARRLSESPARQAIHASMSQASALLSLYKERNHVSARALPHPEHGRRPGAHASRRSRPLTQQALARLWQLRSRK